MEDSYGGELVRQTLANDPSEPVMTGQRDAAIAACVVLNQFFEGQLPYQLINKIVGRVPLDFKQFRVVRTLRLSPRQCDDIYRRVIVPEFEKKITLKGELSVVANYYGYLNAIDKNGKVAWCTAAPGGCVLYTPVRVLRILNRTYLVALIAETTMTPGENQYLWIVDAKGKTVFQSPPLLDESFLWVYDGQVMLCGFHEIVKVWDFVLPSSPTSFYHHAAVTCASICTIALGIGIGIAHLLRF